MRVLLVEDSDDDEHLVMRALKAGGYDVTSLRVETGAALAAALQRETWDVVLSDYHMPSFSAPEAFKVLKESGRDLPFIIVSGTVGEEAAIAAMKVGVHDYLLKGNLSRLGPVIERERREAANRAERRQMQEELLVADRMASMGTLAAGVGHEINNPLAASIGNLELAMDDVAALARDVRESTPQAIAAEPAQWKSRIDKRVSELESILGDSFAAANRVRVIVRDLKLFSRAGKEEERGPVDLRQVLESTLRMAWNEIRHRARLTKTYGDDVPPVWANESRLGQVFLNLIMNAAQAIPEGRSEEHEIHVSTARDGERAIVEVRDTGSGMPPEILSRVFEAFFTTKPIGVGTGLGLTICHRLVTEVGGSIDVRSTPGEGTCFRVALPVAHTHPAAALRTPGPALLTSRRRGRVAVIDDDLAVSGMIHRFLGGDHEVRVFSSGRQALPALRSETFDVILCDVMMPDLSAVELHQAVLRHDPGLAARMVFMTGGAFTPRAREFLASVPNAQVEKPFDRLKLRNLIASFVNDGRPPEGRVEAP